MHETNHQFLSRWCWDSIFIGFGCCKKIGMDSILFLLFCGCFGVCWGWLGWEYVHTYAYTVHEKSCAMGDYICSKQASSQLLFLFGIMRINDCVREGDDLEENKTMTEFVSNDEV